MISYSSKEKPNQGDTIILNVYAKNSTLNFIKQTLLYSKQHINLNTVKISEFNTPLSPIERTSKKSKQKKSLQIDKQNFMKLKRFHAKNDIFIQVKR